MSLGAVARWSVVMALIAAACSESGSDPATDKGCDGGDKARIADCVDQAAYVKDLQFMAKARPTGAAHHEAVRKHLVAELKAMGYAVTEQAYGVGANVIGELKGKTAPDEIVIVGAHFDGVPKCAAADDNATGTAGALQAAKALARHSWDRTLQIVLWDEEERGLTGSFHHANALADANKKVVTVYDLEMIGFISDQPKSQNLPAGFEYIFTEAGAYLKANSNTGDFIAAIYGKDDQAAYDALAAAAKTHGLPIVPVGLDAPKMEAGTLADLRRSDHAAFWSAGYPAMMLTDTANFRNTHYHCTEGEDSVDRLNHPFAIAVVKATVDAAANLLKAGSAAAIAPFSPACDLAKQDCPAGEKCIPFSHGSRWVPTCKKIADNATQHHKSCKRLTKLGDDDCDKGLFCSPWGVPYTQPASFQCLKVCSSDAACDKGDVCTTLGWRPYGSGIAPRRSAVCLKKCDPFNDTCGDKLMCGSGLLGTDSMKDVHTCMAAGEVAEGKECSASIWGQCVKGTDCVRDSKGETQTCRTRCDDKHPCAGGKTCFPYKYAERSGLGHCL